MAKTQADLLAEGRITLADEGENTCPHCGEPLWAEERDDDNTINCPGCGETYRRDEAVWVPAYPELQVTKKAS